MKILLYILALFFSINCFGQSTIYQNDSEHNVVYRGSLGSLYGLIIPVHDTGSIPLAKRYNGLMVIQPSSFDLWAWITGAWVPMTGGGTGGDNISNADLTSDADHNWSLAGHSEAVFGFTYFYFNVNSVPSLYMDTNQTNLSAGVGANIHIVAKRISLANGSIFLQAPTTTTKGELFKVDTVLANITLDSNYNAVTVSAATASDTVFLPPAASYFDVSTHTGIHYIIKRVDTDIGNHVIIKPSGSETIDGATTKTLNPLGAGTPSIPDHASIFTNGVTWWTY